MNVAHSSSETHMLDRACVWAVYQFIQAKRVSRSQC